jgi:hypothetical protein
MNMQFNEDGKALAVAHRLDGLVPRVGDLVYVKTRTYTVERVLFSYKDNEDSDSPQDVFLTTITVNVKLSTK